MLRHFRTYFIAGTTNTYATMHYNFRDISFGIPGQALNPLLENPRRRPPPPSMQQCHHPGLRFREVNRGAVGDPDGEQDPRLTRGVTVEPREEVPPGANSLVPADLGPVHLAGEEKGRKLVAEGTLEGAP